MLISNARPPDQRGPAPPSAPGEQPQQYQKPVSNLAPNWKQDLDLSRQQADYLFQQSFNSDPRAAQGLKSRSGWESLARGIKSFVPAFMSARHRKRANEIQGQVDEYNQSRMDQFDDLDPNSQAYGQFLRSNIFDPANTKEMSSYFGNEHTRYLNEQNARRREAQQQANWEAQYGPEALDDKQQRAIDLYKSQKDIDFKNDLREKLWNNLDSEGYRHASPEEVAEAGLQGQWQIDTKTGKWHNLDKPKQRDPESMTKQEKEQIFNMQPFNYIGTKAGAVQEAARNMQTIDIIKRLSKIAEQRNGFINQNVWFGFLSDIPQSNKALKTVVETLDKNIGRIARREEKAAGEQAPGQQSNWEAQQLAYIYGSLKAGEMDWPTFFNELQRIERSINQNLVADVVQWAPDGNPYAFGAWRGDNAEQRNLAPYLNDPESMWQVLEYNAQNSAFDSTFTRTIPNLNPTIVDQYGPVMYGENYYIMQALRQGLQNPVQHPGQSNNFQTQSGDEYTVEPIGE